MKIAIGSLAIAALALTTASASAGPRKAPRAPGVHPEVAAMIKSNQRSPYVPNLGLYEWRQSMDTHSGVPPLISGASQVNPWVNRHAYRSQAGMRGW